jgi:hypothetical protein
MELVNRIGRVLTGGTNTPQMARHTAKKKHKLEGKKIK